MKWIEYMLMICQMLGSRHYCHHRTRILDFSVRMPVLDMCHYSQFLRIYHTKLRLAYDRIVVLDALKFHFKRLFENSKQTIIILF